LRAHTIRLKSQFRKIKEIKSMVNGGSKVKMIRIDWSEALDLPQTRQEKGDYYHTRSVNINTAVLYEGDGITAIGTFSDAKSKKAAATWASLRKMLYETDFSDTETLFIVSDSPTSQYRNVFNAYLENQFALEKKIQVCHVFTEAGHGKGPMDGVGAVLKKTAHRVIAYRRDAVITNTQQLLEHFPPTNISISTYTNAYIELITATIPSHLRLLSKGMGIGSVHEWIVAGDDSIKLKRLSQDQQYATACFSSEKLFKGRKKRVVEDTEDQHHRDDEEVSTQASVSGVISANNGCNSDDGIDGIDFNLKTYKICTCLQQKYH